MELSKILYLWARACPERREQLQEWLDIAVTKCATGQGATLASSTANGISVTFMSDSMTIVEWMSELSQAILTLDNPVVGQKKAQQIFR